MKYVGSKNRIAKQLLSIILKDYKVGQTFYDLFCGGCNLIDKVPSYIPRFANDNNKYLIALFKELQKDDFKFPDFIDEEKYKEIQNNKDNYSDWLVGFVGINLSFGAKFFGGYRRDIDNTRNYFKEALKSLSRQKELIRNIYFSNLDYKEVIIKDNSIIYCDPPYKNTGSYYSNKNEFNYDNFYNFCIKKAKEGNNIFISEYYMPEEDFICIFKKEIVSSLNTNTRSKREVEKLFVPRISYKNGTTYFVEEENILF